MQKFSPRLDLLPEAQRRLWTELSAIPPEFTLYGGTAFHVGKIALPFALGAAGKLYGASFNPEITLKALSYFDDGNLRELPQEVKFRLVDAVREVDLDHLPNVDDFRLSADLDKGLSL